MKLSIAMCTYNGADYLEEQLASFSQQTRLPDELVVYDDCSNDKTVEIIEKFAAAAAFPVRLFVNKKNEGTMQNFENAVSVCEGDVILLSDQDDVWLPKKLAMFEKAFHADNAVGLVFCDAYLVNENLEARERRNWEAVQFDLSLQKKFRKGTAFSVLLYHNVISGCTMAFRSEYKSLILPMPKNLNLILHDHWIGMLLASVSKISILSEPLVKYRQHPKQQIGAVETNIEEVLPSKSPIAFLRKMLGRFETKYSFEDILERLETIRRRIIPVSDANAFSKAVLDDIGCHINHLRFRNEIMRNPKRHISIIIRELTAFRYHRYSNGISSAVKDYFSAVERS